MDSYRLIAGRLLLADLQVHMERGRRRNVNKQWEKRWAKYYLLNQIHNLNKLSHKITTGSTTEVHLEKAKSPSTDAQMNCEEKCFHNNKLVVWVVCLWSWPENVLVLIQHFIGSKCAIPVYWKEKEIHPQVPWNWATKESYLLAKKVKRNENLTLTQNFAQLLLIVEAVFFVLLYVGLKPLHTRHPQPQCSKWLQLLPNFSDSLTTMKS